MVLSPLFIGVSVLLLALAGCADPPPDTAVGPRLHETERASYDVTFLGGQDTVPIGRFELAVRVTPDNLTVVATKLPGHDSAQPMFMAVPEEVRGVLDRSDGRLVSWERPGHRWWGAWGTMEVVPNVSAYVLPRTDPYLSRQLLLVGPQWAVWHGLESGSSSFAWGEGTATVETTADGWTATVQGACQVACNAAGNLTWTMQGNEGEFLPTRATLDQAGGVGQLAFRRLSFESGGEPIMIAAAVAPIEPIRQHRPCGLAPCEPEDWPVRLSLQHGLEAEATYEQAGLLPPLAQERVPFLLVVSDVSAPGVSARGWQWSLRERDASQERTVALIGAADDAPPILGTTLSQPHFSGPEVFSVWSNSSVQPLDTLVQPILNATGMPAASLGSLAFVFVGSSQDPDPRGATRLETFHEDIRYSVSAVTGDLLEVDHRQIFGP